MELRAWSTNERHDTSTTVSLHAGSSLHLAIIGMNDLSGKGRAIFGESYSTAKPLKSMGKPNSAVHLITST